MSDGHLVPSGHNWVRIATLLHTKLTCWLQVEGQGTGARIDKVAGEGEETLDAMGNTVEGAKKVKKLTSAEAPKAKKDRIARRPSNGVRDGRVSARTTLTMTHASCSIKPWTRT
jgi:elongation factor 3